MKRLGAIAAAGLLLALGLAAVAHGEVEQSGNLIVSFDGEISPHSLPRAKLAPVTVIVDTGVKSADGGEPPAQLRQISIGINRNGKLFDRGLPTCRVREIQPATIAAARRICGGAIVGSGHVQARAVFPNQPPFNFNGPMLVFNAARSGGHRRILAQVYSSRPPSAYVLTFKIFRDSGTFGILIRTTLPRSTWKWAYVTHFEMRLHRTYMYRGRRRSYLSAACAAPEGFPGTVYPFARGSFKFSEGQEVSTELVRDCKVR